MPQHIPSIHEVETYSGQFVNTEDPRPETITLEDIAHALANTCRYGGHCKQFYSVAEHAVFCSIRMERQGYGKPGQLAALHHDDPEAYLGDIPRPLKPLLGMAYTKLTWKMENAIYEALGFNRAVINMLHGRPVKDADNFALLVEARHLLPSGGKGWFEGEQGAAEWGLESAPTRIVVPDYWRGGLTPKLAERFFLNRHKELTS